MTPKGAAALAAACLCAGGVAYLVSSGSESQAPGGAALSSTVFASRGSADAPAPTPGTSAHDGAAGSDAPSPPAQQPRRVSVRRLIGQKLMVGFRGRTVPPPHLLSAIERGHVGGVILFSENTGGRGGVSHMIRTLQHAAAAGHNPPLLISVDQEGGTVRRLATSPPTMSPAQMGAAGRAVARDQGAATGKALRALGINVDLAPVADVPDSEETFLGSRAFGSRVTTVASAATAFARGLQSAGVAATAKHYPGLGTSGSRNTDETIVTLDTSREELTRRAKPFRMLARAGVKLIMVSNAIYRALDGSLPAVLSRSVVSGRLRSFFTHGVIISDALDVPAITTHGRRAPVLATNAGVDVLLYADSDAGDAFGALLAAYRNGTLSHETLRASYHRIVALKREVTAGR